MILTVVDKCRKNARFVDKSVGKIHSGATDPEIKGKNQKARRIKDSKDQGFKLEDAHDTRKPKLK